MKKTKDFILTVVIIVLLLLLALSRCGNTVVDSTEPKVVTVTKYTPGIPDTVYLPQDTIRLIKLKPYPVYPEKDTSNYYYETEVEDSLISGLIASTVAKDGTLVEQDFSYIPKFPKYITRVDTVFTHTKETIEEKDWGIYGGLMVGVYKDVALVPTIGLKTKKDVYFGLGYDAFSQTVLLDVKFKLTGNKN